MRIILVLIAILFFTECLSCSGYPSLAENAKTYQECKYLLFQIFTSDNSNAYPSVPIKYAVADILSRVGSTGNAQHKLGICIGPLSFNQSDQQVNHLIDESFEIATQKDLAIAFHIDDQMFWDKSSQITNSKENLEWSDWHGTCNTGRRLDWSETPIKAPPQLCLNSAAVKEAIRKRATIIGTRIRNHLQTLQSQHKEYLFVGIIAGSETMIGREFSSGKSLGYHALSNLGFTQARPPSNPSRELCDIIRQHIELWADQLAAQGIPRDKIYSHIAFTPQGFEGQSNSAYFSGCATPEIAFDKKYRAGFSTYPEVGAIEEIVSQVKRNGARPWMSAEGTNVVPNGSNGEATMESYLAKMFNNGAVGVNIFSWGIGGEAEKDRNIFRRATENQEALSAYRKFLSGARLEVKPRAPSMVQALRLKIASIQSEIPWFLQRTHRQDLAEEKMKRLDSLLKGNKLAEANQFADEVLQFLRQK